MRKKLTAVLITLFIFASFVIATKFYISQNIELVRVVATAEAIPPRTEITSGMLKMAQVPKGYAPANAAWGIEIFTKDVYFTGELGLHAGEVITQEKVYTQEALANSHVLALAPNETVLGISTDLLRSAGASIYPGSKIRALAYKEPLKGQWQEVIRPSEVQVIFDNLRVVGVVNAEAGDASIEEKRGKVPAVVKVAVTHEQERVLIQYQEEHKVWFTILRELRTRSDNQ
ncbi:MAG: hypothetical protein KGZ79_00370 [Dethiobacter sp.]|jgi:hypothetical protein|nr:hypothetical protein [Dethiobacter sp.]